MGGDMRKQNLALGLLFLLAFSGPGTAQESTAPQAERDIFVKEYIIGPRDLLEIKVFELPELNQTVRVSEDGSITIPLLNRVIVGGMSKDAAERKLAELLEERFVKNPQVSVFIKEYQSRLVAVIGAVENPGMYELVGRQNLLQMISKAGGIRENASSQLFILREGQTSNSGALAIDLEDLLSNGNQKLNVPLQPGDVINIPVDKIILVFVFGEVRNPGALQVKMSKKVTLLQAIAQAGGTTEGASKGGITVKRKDRKTGKEIKMKFNLREIIRGDKPDIELKEGDVVFVPETIF
jgi:polysaccharide export outer membrane protein